MVEVSVTLSDEAFALLKSSAEEKELDISEWIRRVILDRLEDEEDIREANEAYAEDLKNPVTIPHEQFWRGLEAL